MAKNVPSEEIQTCLKSIYEDCNKEDRATRERQIRQWRRLKLLWEGFQRVWYSEVAHDWRVWDQTADQDTDQSYYDKPINVFRAYLESIIAALSITIPPIKCFPDDADNPLDLATAKAGDKISQLIYRHNDVALQWLHALFVYCTEGMVACYSYPLADEKFGTYTEEETEEDEEEHEITTCKSCGAVISDTVINPREQADNNSGVNNDNPIGNVSSPQDNPTQITNNTNSNNSSVEELERQEQDEFMPDNDDAELHYDLSQGEDLCPVCMEKLDPEITRDKFVVTRLVGNTTLPKSRICIEMYGGLNVKVAVSARRQKDTPYLVYSYEYDYALAMERYEHLKDFKDNIKPTLQSGNRTSGSYNQYDEWGRLSPQYQGEFPINVVTINHAWIRPGKYNILGKEQADKLKRLYPDGCKATFVNGQFAEAVNECLDDCWTLTENPFSDYLYFDPLGQLLTSVQEITNDLVSLVLQTIEHGISQTFADPGVLNFNAYQQTETVPGGIFPASPKSGKTMEDAFYELRTATLSGEVLPFYNAIQGMGQLVSGALPSLFGGALVGADTASQYSMSRAQALQRLQNSWRLFTVWWKNIFGKAVPMYIKEVKDDERDVQRDKDGNFINVLIRKAELEGKIGKIELESAENLPMTQAQISDLFKTLLQSSNPEIMQLLNAPENLPIIHEALGLVDLTIPGEDDVIKQYDEIKQLLNSEPIPTGDPQNPFAPSVQIDPIYDNSQIEFEICRKWIISEAGRQAKIDNPQGYMNVLLHGKEHFEQIKQQIAAQGPSQPSPGQTPNSAPPQNTGAPITGESDVSTIQ